MSTNKLKQKVATPPEAAAESVAPAATNFTIPPSEAPINPEQAEGRAIRPSVMPITPAPETPAGPVVVPQGMSADEANTRFGDSFGVDWRYAREGEETPVTCDPPAPEAPAVVTEGIPGDQTPPPVASPPVGYREATEDRELPVLLSVEERDAAGDNLAHLVDEIDELKRKKAAMASSYKGQIDECEEQQLKLAHLIQEGSENRKVMCQWNFEMAGIDDATGTAIYHPEKKTLVRTDTGEVVEVVDMTERDYQMKELALGETAEVASDELPAITASPDGLAEQPKEAR